MSGAALSFSIGDQVTYLKGSRICQGTITAIHNRQRHVVINHEDIVHFDDIT